MKSLTLSLLLIIYAFNYTFACEPIYYSYCETVQYYGNMHVFVGTIATVNENKVSLTVIEALRGEEDKANITIWDGPYYQNTDPSCPFISSGFTAEYGEPGDTVFCIVEFIEEELTDDDVIGDYRRPSTWEIQTYARVFNGTVGSFTYEEFLDYACHKNIYGCTGLDACNYNSSATVDDESCYYDCNPPEVICLEEVHYCETVSTPQAKTIYDFEVSDETTPIEELGLYVAEYVQEYSRYTRYSYLYRIWDEFGNRTTCFEKFYVPKENAEPNPLAILEGGISGFYLGTPINLMGYVQKNESGYWRGKDVFSFTDFKGEVHYYFYGSKIGRHKLYYTVDNGECSETYTLLIDLISRPLRLTNKDNRSDLLMVSPNPTRGKALVNLSNTTAAEHRISVYDLNGQVKITKDVKTPFFELDLSFLPKGIYIMEARNEFGITSKKILKE